MTQIVYVYAVGRSLDTSMLHDVNGVDGTSRFDDVTSNGLTAVFSYVPAQEFSQQAIDARANDLEWLSRIGYSHQRVNERLASGATTVPLRAFTLFSSPDNLLQYLVREHDRLNRTLERLDGRQEWTVRVELEAAEWEQAVVRRVDELRQMMSDAETAPAGKAYLLKKKVEESKKKAARQAEESLLVELESKLRQHVGGELLVENRASRAGSFPQINLLLSAADAEKLRVVETALVQEYAGDGVRLVLTGPWPAYSFAAERNG